MTWIDFHKSGLDDTRIAVEGSLYIMLLLIILTTFGLSLTLLIFTVKGKSLLKAKKILFSTIFFNFFLAFLSFVLCFYKVSTLFICFSVFVMIALSVAGTLYLVEYNEDLKKEKERKNKIDNTAMQDSYYKIQEIIEKNDREDH